MFRSCLISAALLCAHSHAQPYTMSAGSPSRATVHAAAPPALSPTWTLAQLPDSTPLTFLPQAGVVTDFDRVYALARTPTNAWRLIAAWRETGAVAWAAPIDPPIFESWSTPAVDADARTVFVASGSAIAAINAATGSLRWRTLLPRPIVNASPIITATPGSASATDRLYITDYDGFGSTGALHCINIDPRSRFNPFDPGDIVWSVTLGATSGNTPALAAGIVYVASITDESGFSPGVIRAFPAHATSAPAPIWSYTNTLDEGFFGGISIRNSTLYAASYAFFGGQLSANLIALDIRTGAHRWSTPSNRTASTPIPLPDGRIALATGLAGFGSLPALQLFTSSGSLLWDSALATYSDANANGRPDPGEYLALGGWTHQPAALLAPVFGASPALLIAGPPTAGSSTALNNELLTIDLSRPPTAANFILDRRPGAGASPAPADHNIYSVGSAGLVAFGTLPPRYDVDSSGLVDLDDLLEWDLGRGQRDVNRDGIVNTADRTALEAQIRRSEQEDMTNGRR